MKKTRKKYKSVISQRIFQSAKKIGLVFFSLFLILSMGKISGTNSFFMDTATSSGNTLTAGYWIPVLMMTVDPTSPNGDSGWYKTTPCITLSATIGGNPGGSTIYYEFSDDGDPITGGTAYLGACVPVPDGNPTHFQAQAVNDLNSSWVSNIVNGSFKVDTSTIHAGDVVINEVMWMGSEDIGSPDKDGPKDQWIELKNVSNKDLHLKDWYLTYKSNAGNELELIEIKDNRVIKSGEYLLISYYMKNNSAINTQPDYDDMNNFDYNKFQIKLYTSKDKTFLIDTAGSGDKEPTKGDKTNFYSMERNNTPGDGSNYSNWYTCLDASSTGLYWDSSRTERGTPGYKNLSKNDPTSEDYDPAFTEQKYFNEEEMATEEIMTEILAPVVEVPVFDTAPIIEDPIVPVPTDETPAVPADPEVTPEIEPEVAPDTSEEPVVEEEIKEEVEEEPTAEEEPADVPAKEEKEEIKKDDAAKPEDDAGDNNSTDETV